MLGASQAGLTDDQLSQQALVDSLVAADPRGLAAIRRARADVREWVWRLAGQAAPDPDDEVIVDINGVVVLAHSEKQDAAATWKKIYGHHPPRGFVDHGAKGVREPVAGLLRPGNAGSKTAADPIEAAWLAPAQLPKMYRGGRRTQTVQGAVPSTESGSHPQPGGTAATEHRGDGRLPHP